MRDRRKRMTVLAGLTAVLASMFVAVAPTPASAATLCVEPTGASGCFTTIQDAVDNAAAGDTIVVRRGTYFENVVIPAGLDGLTIRNQGATRQIVLDPDAPNTGIGITVEADDVTIRGITIENGEDDGIYVAPIASGALIDRVTVTGPDENCIEIGGPDATVKNSSLIGCGADAINAINNIDNNADGLTIERNKIRNCDSDCIEVVADNVTVRTTVVQTADDGKGIVVRGDQMLIQSNRVSRTDDETYFLTCSLCTGGLVQGNLADFAADDEGFRIEADAPGLVVKQNKAINNGNAGFQIFGVGIRLERNLATGNGGDRFEHGFEISGSGHVLIRNIARDNHGDGFDLGTGTPASMITLDRNLAVNNTDDGFDVENGADVTLTRNRALSNFGVGFEVSMDATNTSLSNNTGSRNRTDFCDEGTGTVLVGNTFATVGACVIDD